MLFPYCNPTLQLAQSIHNLLHLLHYSHLFRACDGLLATHLFTNALLLLAVTWPSVLLLFGVNCRSSPTFLNQTTISRLVRSTPFYVIYLSTILLPTIEHLLLQDRTSCQVPSSAKQSSTRTFIRLVQPDASKICLSVSELRLVLLTL